MDPDRFDTLARELWTAATRRRLLARLAAAPLAGGLVAHFGSDEESLARRKGHNQRQQNKRRSGRRKKNRKGKRKGRAGASPTCRNLGQPCSDTGLPCCAGATCVPVGFGLAHYCERGCESSLDCQQAFPDMDVECIRSLAFCPTTAPCCRPKACTPSRRSGESYNSYDPSTCKHVSGTCCELGFAGVRYHTCCFPGQVCMPGFGCVDNDQSLITDIVGFNHYEGWFCNPCRAESSMVCCVDHKPKFYCCGAPRFCGGSGCVPD